MDVRKFFRELTEKDTEVVTEEIDPESLSDEELTEKLEILEKEAESRGLHEGDKKASEEEEEDEIDPFPLLAEKTQVPGRGAEEPTVAFIGASPSKLDTIRKNAFSGKVGKTLDDVYLDALGIEKADSYFDNVVPVFLTDEDDNPREPTAEEAQKCLGDLTERLTKRQPDYVVALGRTARDTLGDLAHEWVPHPRAVNIYGDSGEVARKLHRLRDSIAKGEDALRWETHEIEFVEKSEDQDFNIIKRDNEEQIVTGIVYEPYVEDTDGNWTTPEEIEKAQRFYVKHAGNLDHEHQEFINEEAVVVENYLAPQDLTIGDQEVAKGSWVMSVQVEDENRWNMVKSGQYTGFSVGAFADIDETQRLNT